MTMKADELYQLWQDAMRSEGRDPLAFMEMQRTRLRRKRETAKALALAVNTLDTARASMRQFADAGPVAGAAMAGMAAEAGRMRAAAIQAQPLWLESIPPRGPVRNPLLDGDWADWQGGDDDLG